MKFSYINFIFLSRFFSETSSENYEIIQRKWSFHILILFFYPDFFSDHWRFTEQLGDWLEYSYLFLPLPLVHILPTFFQFWNWDDNLVFSVTMHVIIQLLVHEIYPLLRISIWLFRFIAFFITYSFISDKQWP